MRSGYGSPEGVITGPIGSVYTQRNGATGKVLWVKESGTGSTGWLSRSDRVTVIDVRDYGAKADGTTDDTAAVLAAFTAANALARVGVVSTIFHPGATVRLQGTFNLATLAAAIPVRCNVESAGSQLIIPAAYAGTVLMVGHATSGSILQDANIELPDVVKPTGTSLVAGSIGVVVQNLYNSDLLCGRTGYFETGLHFTGLGNGTVYNRIYIGLVFYCKVSVKLKPLTGGWVNQNVFVGGGVQQSAGFFGGTRLSGYRHLELDGAGINMVDGNSFYGVSLEGDVSDQCVYVHHANANRWDNCRFEAGTAFASVTVSGSSLTSTAHGLVVGDMIVPTYTVSLPTGMAAVTPYYVVSVTDANTFSISRDKGGSAITFGSAGSGVLYARPHRIYYDTAGVGVSNNVISNPVNPLGWLDIVHSTAIASSNIMETPAYRMSNLYAPEDLPQFRARNSASTLALVRPLFATYAPTVNPQETPDTWSTALSDRGLLWKSGVVLRSGTGTPEGVVTAPIGSIFTRSDGDVGTTVYTKEFGSGNTGWSPMRSTKPRVTTTTSSTTPTPNVANIDIYELSALGAGATFGAPTGTPVDGQSLLIRIKDDGTARTLAWNAIYRAIGTTIPTTTVSGKQLYVGCRYNSTATKWDVLAVGIES